MFAANPMYDVVFRFMMEDNEVAKKFISTIIGEDVVELDFKPDNLPVCCLYFVAKIRTGKNTFKTVTIELQKAKLANDTIQPQLRYSIFLLTHDIECQDRLVIELNHQITDLTTGEVISCKEGENDFIDFLCPRSWIVQLSHLKEHRRNDIEIMLSIFSGDPTKHKIDLNEDDYPDAFHPIIRRLAAAYATPQMEERMYTEDEIIAKSQNKKQRLPK
jgi:hypothetical protein